MISDACTPQIYTDITAKTIADKTILTVEVFPGTNRPYYLKSAGKEKSAYIRINGTSRPAGEFILKELELEGARRSYDMLWEIGELRTDTKETNQSNHEANRRGGESNHEANQFDVTANEIKARLIRMIHDNPRISQRALAKELDIARSTVQRYMAQLEADGKLQRKGGTRGIWIIQEKI